VPLIVVIAGFGAAVALTSPGSVVTVIGLLSMSSGLRRALAFIAGWLVSIGIIVLLVVFVLQGDEFRSRHGQPSRVVSSFEILLGVVLVVVSARALRQPHVQPKSHAQPAWLARLDQTSWLLEVIVGAVMLSYTLTFAAAAETLKAHPGPLYAAVLGLVFAVTSIITISAPVVVAVAAPDRSAAILGRWKHWVLAHSRVIALIALMLIGIFLIGRGAYDLVAP
jgi:Sap, sulfolipid-1-addressing protein